MGSRLFFYYRGSISGVSDFQPTKGLQSSEPNLVQSKSGMVSDHTAFVILWLALHRCRCLWRRRQRRRRCRGLHRPRRGLRPWRHPRHPGPRHGPSSRRPSGVRYPPGRAVVLGLRGRSPHGAGLEVTTGEGVGATSGALSRVQAVSGRARASPMPSRVHVRFICVPPVPSNGFRSDGFTQHLVYVIPR